MWTLLVVQVVRDEGRKEIRALRGQQHVESLLAGRHPLAGISLPAASPSQLLSLHPRAEEPTGLRHFLAFTSVHFRFTLWASKGS